ncbi:MAG: hypothetical protein AAGJ40_11970 [Planctomycetota bacterium]
MKSRRLTNHDDQEREPARDLTPVCESINLEPNGLTAESGSTDKSPANGRIVRFGAPGVPMTIPLNIFQQSKRYATNGLSSHLKRELTAHVILLRRTFERVNDISISVRDKQNDNKDGETESRDRQASV